MFSLTRLHLRNHKGSTVSLQCLNYAVDAEFLKCDGRVYARSVAFVPFGTSVDVPVTSSSSWAPHPEMGNKISKPHDTISPLTGSGGIIAPSTQSRPPPLPTSAMVGAPRKLSAAAEALRRARGLKVSTNTANNQLQQQQIDNARKSLSLSSCLLPSQTFRPIVLAIASQSITSVADVLPCGHTIERLCTSTTSPTASGPGLSVWSPHPLYRAALERQPSTTNRGEEKCVNNSPHGGEQDNCDAFIKPSHFSSWELEPYAIPNVRRHEGLLRRAYQAAVESLEVRVKLIEAVSGVGEGVIGRDGGTDPLSAYTHTIDVERLNKELAAVFSTLSFSSTPKYGRENLLRSIQHPVLRRDALLNRFYSADIFIAFLEGCALQAERALSNAERRFYTTELLGREVSGCGGGRSHRVAEVDVVGGKQIIEEEDSPVSSSPPTHDENMKDVEVLGPVILVDNLQELALATSYVWRQLSTIRDAISSKMLCDISGGIDDGVLGALRAASARRSGFYSYSNSDLKVLQETVDVVLMGATVGSSSSPLPAPTIDGQEPPPSTTNSIRCNSEDLEALLLKYPDLLKIGAKDVLSAVFKNVGGSTSNIDASSPPLPTTTTSLLLRSRYEISIRDITGHTQFRGCGLIQRKDKVPKLVDALGMLEKSHGCASELLKTSSVDLHNPLWDAAALAAICTFVLK